MSADEEISKATEATETATVATNKVAPNAENDEKELEMKKLLKAKELYSQGSRNYLVKSYAEAADQLSEVCELYEELYGELCSELGMPYLLYAKSLIALAIDENKVLDVPDEADDEDDEDDDVDDDDENDESDADTGAATAASSSTSSIKTNGVEKKPTNEADSTAADKDVAEAIAENTNSNSTMSEKPSGEDAEVSSSSNTNNSNGNGEAATSSSKVTTTLVIDGEKPSTSNGEFKHVDEEQAELANETEAMSNLRLAWELLELAAKIFTRQGLSGLPNLAEVQTELANIEFENNIMDSAREDYEKALKIYKELPKTYHRPMAEIHYKIGLTYLMQQMNKEGAASLKEACDLIEAEIVEIKSKDELTEKDKNNIQDMEETKQEIRAKIDEIEETQAQNIAEVRAALDSYIKPIVSQNAEDAGTSSSSTSKGNAAAAAASGSSTSITSSSSSSTSSSKPTDISHLIKRKKPEESSSEAEASPAKRPAV